MGIDLIIALLALAALYLGYQRGLILAVFSFVSIWLGIFLAFKFSAVVAGWLGELVSVSDRWMPLVAFLAILIGVVILVRLGAKALEGVLELAQLGTINRLSGAILYLALLLSLSAAVFQGLQWAGVVSATDLQESYYLQAIQPFFMELFQGMGRWIPGGKDVYDSLEQYFKTVPESVSVL
jgi:membrane protein required for colicin V production